MFMMMMILISQTARLKKVIEHKMCVLIFCLQLVSQTFPILRIIERDNLINVHRYSCKVRIILVGFE